MNNSLIIEENEVSEDVLQCLHFVVGSDSYGLDINQVKEVIEFRQMSRITRIPMVHESILGVINLRGQIIPVVDSSVRLYNRKTDINLQSSIVIVDVSNSGEHEKVGLMINAVKGVEDIGKNDITDVPDFGTKIRQEFIDKIVNIKDTFVVLLNIDELLNINELSELKSVGVNFEKLMSVKSVTDTELTFGQEAKEQNEKNEETGDEHVFVTFNVYNEIYGIDIKDIHEIINITKMTSIPNTLPFMKGVINLRGRVVPVVDMRERCGLELIEYNNKTPILIIELQNTLIGLIIDSVYNVVKYPVSKIQHPPHYSAKIDSDFIDGLVQLDDKTIITINVRKILTTEEHVLLNNQDFNKEEQ